MIFDSAPIRFKLLDSNGLVEGGSWAIWFQKLVKGLNGIISQNDIEIVGDTKGLILESPDGTRWRVQVTNAGALTITSL